MYLHGKLAEYLRKYNEEDENFGKTETTREDLPDLEDITQSTNEYEFLLNLGTFWETT